jgi:hypothetical protein
MNPASILETPLGTVERPEINTAFSSNVVSSLSSALKLIQIHPQYQIPSTRPKFTMSIAKRTPGLVKMPETTAHEKPVDSQVPANRPVSLKRPDIHTASSSEAELTLKVGYEVAVAT